VWQGATFCEPQPHSFHRGNSSPNIFEVLAFVGCQPEVKPVFVTFQQHGMLSTVQPNEQLRPVGIFARRTSATKNVSPETGEEA